MSNNRKNRTFQKSICISEYQHAGRGQKEKKWITQCGSSIAFSMFFMLTQKRNTALISIIVALSVVEILSIVEINAFKLKWPNDIYFGLKKIAGILVSAKTEFNTHTKLTIGVGLNAKNFSDLVQTRTFYTNLK